MICRELKSCHFYPYRKKKVEQTKINCFSWTHQRTQVAGKTTIPNLERQANLKNHSQDVLLRSGGEATGATN